MRKGTCRSIITVAVAILIFSAVVAPALSAPDDAYKKLPGYVEFGKLGVLEQIEPRVEIFLKGPLLKLAREAVKHEDPELSIAMAGIQLVRVHVYPLDRVEGADVAKETKRLALELEKKGWEMTVRVREDDEDVYIYFLPGKNEDIEGLVVMVVEDDDEAVFVNIVGTIDPEQVGRISHSIGDLHSIDLHLDTSDDESDEEDEKEKKKKRTHR